MGSGLRQENDLIERAEHFMRRIMQAEKALAMTARKIRLGGGYQRVAPRIPELLENSDYWFYFRRP